MVDYKKLILVVALVILSSVTSFGVLSSNGQSHIYYINSQDPLINITLKSFDDPFTLRNAQILSPDKDKYVSSIGSSYSGGAQANHVLDLTSFLFEGVSFSSQVSLTHGSVFDFYLDVVDSQGEEPSTQGIPTRFQVQIDTKEPELVFDEGLTNYVVSTGNLETNLEFSEPLQYLKVYKGDEIFIEENVVSFQAQDFISNYEFRIFNSSQGLQEYQIDMIDRAGNLVSTTLSVLVSGDPLSLNLLTRAQDSSLTYYFNSSQLGLFEKNIYSNSQDLVLTFESSKNARCFFSDQLSDETDLSLKSVQEWLGYLGDANYEEMQTSQGGTLHSIPLTLPDNSVYPFFVGCYDRYNTQDDLFLSETLTNNEEMMNLVYYQGGDLSLAIDSPASLVGQSDVFFQTTTSSKAACSLHLQDEKVLDFATNDYLTHTSTPQFSDGEYDFTFFCYDVVYNTAQKTKTITVDKSAGISLTFTSPNYYEGIFYSPSSSIDVEFSTGQTPDSCRFSTTRINPQVSAEFESVTEIESTISSNQFSFQATSLLAQSNNTHYIYCKSQEGLITTTELPIVYDSLGPQLSNLRFNNYGSFSEEFIGSPSSLTTQFLVDSLTPISLFRVSLFGSNSTSEIFEFSNSQDERNYTKELKISENLENYNKVVIIAQTIIGTNSSPLTKNFALDLSPPQVSLSNLGGKWTITCEDLQSGCAKSWIGVSRNEGSCNPTTPYTQNLTLNTTGFSYVCAEAQNYAGVISSLVTKETGFIPLTETPGTINLTEDTSSNQSSSNQTQNNTPQNETSIDDEPLEYEPFEPQGTKDSSTPYYILTAVVLLLAFSGAGGWYAYKKGYLDDQLEKMGIHVKKPSSASNSASSLNFQTGTQKRPKLVSKKSKYDQHLKKLNKFLDDQLDKNQGVYDSFSESQKGKVKGYKDSMHNQHTKDVNKSSYDEFYDVSKENSQGKSTLEEDAENFEKYYHKKKQNNKK